MTILQILTELANTPSKNGKLDILTREKNNELLSAVFKAAYDPTINYFQKLIPEYESTGKNIPLIMAIAGLRRLSQREVTGTPAIIFLARLLSELSDDDAQVIERIIQRDLKCGCSESTANKVWKKLIPEFPYLRCSLVKDAKFDKWDWTNGVYSQLKADSMFANIDITMDRTFIITSRAGSEFDSAKFQNIIDEMSKIPDNSRLNGELMVKRDGVILSRKTGNGILNSVLKGGSFGPNEQPTYVAWDILPLTQAVPNGRIKVPYKARFAELCKYVTNGDSFTIIETKIVHSLEEAYQHYFEKIKDGLEGTIIKNPSAEWFDGTSKDQIKLKVHFEVDLEIVGFNDGNGRNEDTFGSIACQSSDGLLRVDIPGRGDEMRQFFHDNRDTMIGRIIACEANDITKDERTGVWSLFLPVFLELREDKHEADSYQKVRDQYNAVIQGK